jgi:hypothetical protein
MVEASLTTVEECSELFWANWRAAGRAGVASAVSGNDLVADEGLDGADGDCGAAAATPIRGGAIIKVTDSRRGVPPLVYRGPLDTAYTAQQRPAR